MHYQTVSAGARSLWRTCCFAFSPAPGKCRPTSGTLSYTILRVRLCLPASTALVVKAAQGVSSAYTSDASVAAVILLCRLCMLLMNLDLIPGAPDPFFLQNDSKCICLAVAALPGEVTLLGHVFFSFDIS